MNRIPELTKIKAVIFDLNGVIIDDEKFHHQSWRRYCQKYGFHLTEEEFSNRVSGRTEKEVFEFLHQHSLTPSELARFSDERVDFVIKSFRPKIKLIAGLARLFEVLQQNNIPMGVATSSRNRYVDFIMDTLQIRNYFNVIVTAEDIVRGKPDPEIYLKTAQNLDIKPGDCIVFEDSFSGILAAKSAGMKVIGVTTTHSAKELNQADMTIKNFSKLFPDIP